MFSGIGVDSRNIHLAVERASKIVFALKKYAHHDRTGEKVLTDLIDSLEMVLTLFHNHIKQGVEVVKNFKTIPKIMCYRDELNQVWTNLIQNALQAIKNKGILQIDIEGIENNIVIRIIDNGPGIPEEIKSRIFEAFFTTKISGEGCGLGLDISKKIIEKHLGTIEFESIPGKTTFQVQLPIIQSSEELVNNNV